MTEAFQNIPNYTAHLNIGTEGRWTAVLAKDVYTSTNIKRIPSGRGIAATFNGISIVKLYAPAGARNKRARKTFYNADVILLLDSPHTPTIIAEDFNCVLDAHDCTGQLSTCRAVKELVTAFRLHDVWTQHLNMKICTHCTTRGVSRIDRIYITQGLRQYKKHTETVAAAFADHLAALLYMTCPIPTITKEPSYWELNPFLLTTEGIIEAFIAECSKWKTSQRRYASQVHWWCNHVKRKIRLFFNSLLKTPLNHTDKALKLKQLKAKLLRLTSNHRRDLLLNSGDHTTATNEDSTLYHLIRSR
jgi:endonuclease/exonuclease/phosphatase family metal-dependent hydrolase